MADRKGVAPADFDDSYRKTVCKIGQGSDCCRYIVGGADGFECAKRTSMRFAIDQRADDMRAKGDNCDGCYEPRRAFQLLKDRFGHAAGTIIYEAKGYDYGLASDDARAFGVPHTSMTIEPSGDYPFFTVPDSDFAPVEQVPA